VDEIAAKVESALEPAARETVVRDTVAQFERLGLVEPSDRVTPKMSRRELVRKIGIGALAAGVVLPLVTSIAAPAAAQMASCRRIGQSCNTQNLRCCPGLECEGTCHND
jgi:hypothetical protein